MSQITDYQILLHAGDCPMMSDCMMGGMLMPWMMAGWWPLILALFLVVIVAVLGSAWLARTITNRSAETPMEILRERYARGEISAEQYETGKRQLAQD